MKITVMTALAAATFAFAPLAQAQEGNSDPFPFSAGPIGAVQFIDGVAVALPDQPAPAYAARDEAPLPPATKGAPPPCASRCAAPGTIRPAAWPPRRAKRISGWATPG